MAELLFKNSWKRVDRAVMHGKALAAEWAALLPNDNYGVEVKEEDSGAFVAAITFEVPAENTLALELGEFFYQLRSSLDGAIWQAVTIMEGTEPTADINRLDFPICVEQRQFDQSAIHKHKFPQELRDWLQSIQPYCAEKPSGHPDRGLEVTLELLHDLARKDRHRRLRVVAAVPSALEFAFDFDPPADAITIEGIRCNFLEGEREFLRFHVQARDGSPIDKVVLATKLKIEIAIDEIPMSGSGGLTEEMVRFVAATKHVIQRFEKVFG